MMIKYMKLEKRIKNESGDLLVRETDNCGKVEILHLYDNNKSGCVIGYWKERMCDGYEILEFTSVHDRLTKTKYDNADVLLEALIIGQSFADIIMRLKD